MDGGRRLHTAVGEFKMRIDLAWDGQGADGAERSLDV
jgi:hypothetical protein